MISRENIYTIGSAVALVITSQSAFASAWDELNATDQEKVKRGEQVALYFDSGMPNAPWPICKVYQKVEASPVEVAAVFSDFNSQSSYVPNLTKSEVLSRSKNTVEVSYQLTMPMGFGVENYVAHDTITSYDGGASYKVDWNVYPTPSFQISRGNARFETLEGGTLFVYENFIFPLRWGSSLSWVVERSKKQVRDTVSSIVKHVYEVKQSDPNTLKDQIGSFESMLSESN